MKWIKKHLRFLIILLVLVVLLSLLGVLLVSGSKRTGGKYGSSGLRPTVERALEFSKDAPAGGFLLAAETDTYQLFFRKDTTEVALRRKDSGDVWFSNPQDRDSAVAEQGDAKTRLSSQLRLEYYNSKSQVKQLDNYNHSIKGEQFTVDMLEAGLRVTYTIGMKELTREFLPLAVEKSRFEERILQHLDGDDKALLERRYQLIGMEITPEEDRAILLADYPIMQNMDLYILRQFTPAYEFQAIFDIIFGKTPYTETDRDEDNIGNGLTQEPPAFEQFVIPLEYVLTDDGLEVNIPGEAIEAPEAFTINKLYVEEYFGAIGLPPQAAAPEESPAPEAEDETGAAENAQEPQQTKPAADVDTEQYLFIPDGSGGLIYANNGRLSANAISLPVYGEDAGITKYEKLQDNQPVMAPVYGIRNKNSALFAILTDGESHASIQADISGRNTSYNKVYPCYEIRPKDIMVTQTRESQVVNNRYQDQHYQGNTTLLYQILPEKKADYTGMAKAYREYLIRHGELTAQNSGSRSDFLLEFIGSVEDTDNVFGVEYKTLKPLTTFGQMQDILSELSAQGVDRLDVKMAAWYQGGLYNRNPGKASPASVLGGKKDFSALQNWLTEHGGALYPDTAIVEVYSGFPSFNPYKNAVRYTYNKIAEQVPFGLSDNLPDTTLPTRYMLAPGQIPTTIQQYVDAVKKQKGNSVWFHDAASLLNSDFHQGVQVDRQVAVQLTQEALAAAKESGVSIGLDAANAYGFQYADRIVGVPMTSSGFPLVNESVPFLPMVFSGTDTAYAGEPINLSGQSRTAFLKAVETGAGLYFKWIYASNEELRALNDTRNYSGLYSLYYGDWQQEAIDDYRQIKELETIRTGPILAHEKLDDQVYKTTWSGGHILVNYGDAPYRADGILVGAKDYKAVRGNGG